MGSGIGWYPFHFFSRLLHFRHWRNRENVKRREKTETDRCMIGPLALTREKKKSNEASWSTKMLYPERMCSLIFVFFKITSSKWDFSNLIQPHLKIPAALRASWINFGLVTRTGPNASFENPTTISAFPRDYRWTSRWKVLEQCFLPFFSWCFYDFQRHRRELLCCVCVSFGSVANTVVDSAYGASFVIVKAVSDRLDKLPTTCSALERQFPMIIDSQVILVNFPFHAFEVYLLQQKFPSFPGG